MLSHTIDQIYEASVAVERWPAVLDHLTNLAGGVGASLLSGGQRPIRWIATPVIDNLIQDYARQSHANSRMSAGMPRSMDGFLTDTDFFTSAQMDGDPFYTEFLRPRGYGWCLGTTINAPGVDPIVFSIERLLKSGPAEARDKALFNALRPHLARAMLLSSRLNLQRAQAKAEALSIVGLPAAVIDSHGRGLVLNDQFQSIIPSLVKDRRERLSLSQPKADKLFVDALLRLGSSDFAGSQSIPIQATVELPAAVVHLVPVRGLAHDIFSPGLALILITPLVPSAAPSAKLLEALFDLTPAEARVAQAIAETQHLDELAKVRGVTKETVRAQLRAIFAKTGTRRQTELVRLLTSFPTLTC